MQSVISYKAHSMALTEKVGGAKAHLAHMVELALSDLWQ